MQFRLKSSSVYFLLVVVLFVIFDSYAGPKAGENIKKDVVLTQPFEYWDKLLAMEKEFLAAKNGAMVPSKSGEYILSYEFPDKAPKVFSTRVSFSAKYNLMGGLDVPEATLDSANFWRKNNAIYWLTFQRGDRDKGIDRKIMHFVGIVDADGIWGHVYVFPVGKDAWNPHPYEIGVFTLKPKNEE